MDNILIYNNDYEFLFHEYKYHFIERKFYEGKFSMRIPKSFVLMPESVKRIYQPGSQPEQLLLTDDSSQFSISLLKTSDTLNKKIMEKQLNICKTILPRMASGVHIYEADIIKGDFQSLAYFEYTSDGMLERMYNCMFLTGMNGHMVWGTISFSYNNQSLKSLAKKISCSCHDITNMRYKNVK